MTWRYRKVGQQQKKQYDASLRHFELEVAETVMKIQYVLSYANETFRGCDGTNMAREMGNSRDLGVDL